MGKRCVLSALAALCLCFFAYPALSEGINRALLVGCDSFVTQASTTPSSANNVTQMAETLSGGAMNLETLITRKNDVTSPDELEQLVLDAFGAADSGDVSYFYISTHGVWTQGQPNGDMTLLLSDGVTENGLTANRLRSIFDRIAGTKVLILDACHAGAMIGKGVHAPYTNIFLGSDYKVLCSSGGAEDSWFWSGASAEDSVAGAGYFSGALVSGLSVTGSFGADANRDGAITLSELKRYLMDNHGASTPQSYPEESDFVVLRYDESSVSGRRRDAAVEGVSFVEDVLSIDAPTVDFSFTVLRPTRVAYQFIYQQSSRWNFENSHLLYDNAERFGVYGDAQGYLSPGMKTRSITLSRTDTGSYGYVLMQMLTLQDGVPALAASRVLCVPPATGDPLLELMTSSVFCPQLGEELNLVIHHQYPCELTVTIEDMTGQTVRRLTSRQPSRPQQLLPRGTTLCWNGLRNNGEAAAEGQYRVRVKAYIGDEMYEAVSEPFALLSPNG